LADPQTLLTQPCDILVPAALERVINAETARNLRCRILAEAANGPTTPDADLVLQNSDIFVIPDILCNAGGVIVSYFEWVQDLQQLFWEENEVNHRLAQILDRAYNQVTTRTAREHIPNRTAAMAIGVEKVYAAKKIRGLFP
jgi:glutamate dehydrogenase (NAD(P)+)